MAIILGQHVRVGIEDNLWNSKRQRMTTIAADRGGRADSAERFGRKIATAEEAREIMKIGVWYDSVEETLKNLGMPPNRGDDDRGFMVWETDGKKSVAASDVRLASRWPTAWRRQPAPSQRRPGDLAQGHQVRLDLRRDLW